MSQKKKVRLAGAALDRSPSCLRLLQQQGRGVPSPAALHQGGLRAGQTRRSTSSRTDIARSIAGCLEQAGIDVAEAERKGQLEVRRWEDAYLRDGHFDQNKMLALIEEVLQNGKAQGYALTRLIANMEWALEDRPGVDDIVEYETRLNFILPKYDDAVC